MWKNRIARRLLALAVCAVLLVLAPCAVADDLDRFQPYTDVDLSVFRDAGYTVYYDQYAFSAELGMPEGSKIEAKTDTSTYMPSTCTVRFDVKIVYSAGKAVVIPRIIFGEEGYNNYAYRMGTIYIKNGENRYTVTATNSSRSVDSKNYSATESTVQPLYLVGCYILQDMAEHGQVISMQLTSYKGAFTFTAADNAVLKSFYDTCKKAGVFEQEYLLTHTDNYRILTQFNEGSTGQESPEEEPAPETPAT